MTDLVPGRSHAPAEGDDVAAEGHAPTLLLVACVKEKLAVPAAARDLYVSPLFKKEREYAERVGLPWFILSAEHGLVVPDEWLSPYERYLPDTSPSFRRAWGTWVVERLELLTGGLDGRTIEIHAGATYVDALRGPLADKGVSVYEPLAGLGMGQRLAWYGAQPSRAEERDTPGADLHTAADGFCERLTDDSEAIDPWRVPCPRASGPESAGALQLVGRSRGRGGSVSRLGAVPRPRAHLRRPRRGNSLA